MKLCNECIVKIRLNMQQYDVNIKDGMQRDKCGHCQKMRVCFKSEIVKKPKKESANE